MTNIMVVKNYILTIITFISLVFYGCKAEDYEISGRKDSVIMNSGNLDTATFGSGCFWCTEAVFLELKGVVNVSSGYSGGSVPNPSYEDVCSGETGHAEVIQVIYDTTIISYEKLLEVFWATHDPTTLNRQGHDAGTQYRSVIFYHNAAQRELAQKYKKALNESEAFSKPVVTEISPFTKFYKAENYHQNYYNNNKSQTYCGYVIKPKLEKFRQVFGQLLK